MVAPVTNAIAVLGEARPVLEQNLLQRSSKAAVWIGDSAVATLRRNTLERNHGAIFATNSAHVVAERNDITDTRHSGLYVEKTATARAVGNTFRGNGVGLRAVADAQLTALANDIRENRIGVMLCGQAAGELARNAVESSTTSGVTEAAGAESRVLDSLHVATFFGGRCFGTERPSLPRARCETLRKLYEF